MDYRPLYENAIFIAPSSEEGFFALYRKAFPKVKFDVLTIEEVEGMFAYSYDEDALAYLVGQGYSYPKAKELMVGLTHMKEKEYHSPKLQSLLPVFRDMVALGYLYQDALPFRYFKGRNIVIRGYSDGKRIATALEPLPNISVCWDNLTKPRVDLPPYYAFNDIHQELHFLCNTIAKYLKNGAKAEDICILGLPSECHMEMAMLCKSYKIPVSLPKQNSLYDLPFVHGLLTGLSTKEVGEVLSAYDGLMLDKNRIDALSLLSLYAGLGLAKDRLCSVMEDVYKGHRLHNPKGEGIRLATNRHVMRGCHAFVVDFSFGKSPRIHRDNTFFNDEERKELGLPTSALLNARDERELSALLTCPEIEYVSYSAARYGTPLYPSPWGDDNVHTKKNVPTYEEELSEEMARFVATSLNDDYDRVRKESPYRASMNAQVELPKRYDPQFKPFEEARRKGELHLSYSSLNGYYQCPFSYYLSHVFHLKDNSVSFYSRLGTMLHSYLEEFSGQSFDYGAFFDQKVEEANASGPAFTAKERFLLKNIKPLFLNTLDFLAVNYTQIEGAKFFHEFPVRIRYENDVILTGSIDLAIESGLDKRYISILDYKTRGKTYNEKETKYGLNLQLPLYAYFASQIPEFKDDELLGIYFVPMVVSPDAKTNSLQGRHENIPEYAHFDPNPTESGFVDKKAAVAVDYPGELGESLSTLAKEKLDEAIGKIRGGEYPISPITIGEKDKSCTYCPYGDICYQRDEHRRYVSDKENDDEADA